MQSIKRECLSQFVVFGERHLEYLIRECKDYYNSVRPHQGLGNKTIGIAAMPPPGSDPPAPPEIRVRVSSERAFAGTITAKQPKFETNVSSFGSLHYTDSEWLPMA
ncbi:MAG: integrase core domain-containing protein [Chthoniobacteraceae bacterium]